MLKYKKYQKRPIKGLSFKSTHLSFGSYGIKFLENGEITFEQYDLFNKTLLALQDGELFFWWRICIFWPKTFKNPGARMGSGKGLVSKQVLKVFKGQVFVEFGDYPLSLIVYIMLQFLKKSNLKLAVIKKSL